MLFCQKKQIKHELQEEFPRKERANKHTIVGNGHEIFQTSSS